MKKFQHSKSTTRRFFLRHSVIPNHITPVTQFILSEDIETEIFNQLTKVFRSTIGQEVILINKLNFPETSRLNIEYLFTITILNKKNLTLQLLQTKEIHSQLIHPLHLALCLPSKPAKLDWILEKATELGVQSIRLIKSDLSQFQHQLKTDRLDKIVTEAAEQSEQALPPDIKIIDNLDKFIQNNPINCLVALERTTDSKSLLELTVTTETTVLIGPEGGFSGREVSLIREAPLAITNLGGSILKMDTAALLAVGILTLKLQR